MRKLIFFAFFLLAIASALAQTYTVGVSPKIVDLGTVEPGKTYRIKFYIVSPSNEDILVKLIEEDGNSDFILSNYQNFLANYSEQSCKSFVQYFSNPVLLKPQNEPLITQIGKVNNWREIEVLLNIPKDVEAGLHYLTIQPEPQISPAAGGQVGIGITSVSKVHIIFNIAGNAFRDGEILDALGEGNRVKVYFKNTGTVTMKVSAKGQIFDKNSTFNFTTSSVTIKPGELGELIGFLEKPLNGNYDARIEVNFLSASKEKTMNVIFVSKPTAMVAKEFDLRILFYLIAVIVIVLVAFWIYKKS